jgi:hypothetical protein
MLFLRQVEQDVSNVCEPEMNYYVDGSNYVTAEPSDFTGMEKTTISKIYMGSCCM